VSGGSGQLPLALRLRAPAVFETFVTTRDRGVVAHLEASAAGRERDLIWLAGESGSGKTHLLQAVCRAADEGGRRAMYLNMAHAAALDPTLLAGLEQRDVLALDDVDSVAGRPAWEAALFAVFNAFHLGPGVLLLAAERNPAGAGFALPDLASRAAGGGVYRLHGLDDAQSLEALAIQARFRGLDLDDAAARYLLSRVRRGMPELCDWLDRIDRLSLAAQRKVTVSLIREVLQEPGE
jgi:DnaA family protein